jgi:hypothetical protein
MQYHQGQVTVERLVSLLLSFGVSISKREVSGKALAERVAVLLAGATAAR